MAKAAYEAKLCVLWLTNGKQRKTRIFCPAVNHLARTKARKSQPLQALRHKYA
jgi:hypothetical protein